MKSAVGPVRVLLAVVAGIVVFLATMGGTCDAVGGVPVWDRCTSWLGTPLVVDWPSGILDLAIPLAIGTGFGAAAWWMLGMLMVPKRDR